MGAGTLRRSIVQSLARAPGPSSVPEPKVVPLSEEPAVPHSDDELACAEVVRQLEELVADPKRMAALPDALRTQLISACGRLSRPNRTEKNAFKKERRRLRREERRDHDRALLDRTRVRSQRIELVYPTPDPLEDPRDRDVSGLIEAAAGSAQAPDATAGASELIEGRTCYICKAEYRQVHDFYDALCPECADFNYEKRYQTADLSGRVSLLTGGRVKIGYQAGIKLLRAGSRLIVTTRFPRDAAMRYAAEKDFADWHDRLDIYGLDLRHTPSVEALMQHIQTRYDRLDFILNNACQTVRRPPGFYAHLMEAEELPYAQLGERTRRLVAAYEELREELRLAPGATDNGEGQIATDRESKGVPVAEPRGDQVAGISQAAGLSQVPLVAGDVDVGDHLFPEGKLDADLQQVDLRSINSWRLPLAQVSTVELLEVHLVNAVAPFVFNARLKELMLRHPGRDKHIVNVSAMEGQFYRAFKTDKHPHTNMAKASLNMMTRTSAPDYHRDGIHMNSVDTGWITDEDPIHITKVKQEEHGFHPPLDHVDAAARICAPIFDGFLTGEHAWGQFLKDYKPTRW